MLILQNITRESCDFLKLLKWCACTFLDFYLELNVWISLSRAENPAQTTPLPDRLSSSWCSVMLHIFSQWERGTSETVHLWVLFFPSEFHKNTNSSLTSNTVLASPTLGNQKVNTQKIYTQNRHMFSSYLLFLSDWVDQNACIYLNWPFVVVHTLPRRRKKLPALVDE